jgi:outer membrane protein assembly factor BamA
MKRRITTIMLFLCSALPLRAQTDTLQRPAFVPFVVDTIIISGNEKTKEYVILDEMTIKPDSLATLELMEFDRRRVYSLGLFTTVEIGADTLEGRHALLVDVKERWYWIPLLAFGFRDGDPQKPYYGGGLQINNFRGRNQRLHGIVIFGYDPSLGFGFADPLIIRSPNFNFAGNVSYARLRNKSKTESDATGDFTEDHFDINLTLGHRYTLFESVASTIGFTVVEVSEYRPGRTASPTGKDQYLYVGLGYARDTRDLIEYPTKGSLIDVYITKNGLGESTVSFTRFGVDIRKYLPLPLNFTVAGRAHTTLLGGTFIPTYARTYLGYGERIRGYYDAVFEGENLLGASLELHWPLLKTRTFNFTAISIPDEFSVWQFGIGLALFADSGVTWFRDRRLTINSFASGYGGGIHFLLPYSAIMRVEYAMNEYGSGQFILDFRTSI